MVKLKNPAVVGNLIYSNNGLTATRNGDSTSYDGTVATVGKSIGKWYWEVYIDMITQYCGIGITSSPTIIPAIFCFGFSVKEFDIISSGLKMNEYKSLPYGTALKQGDTLGIALDLNAHTITFYINGVSFGVAYSNLPIDTYYPGFSTYNGGKFTFNFGDSQFKYPIPGHVGYNGIEYSCNMYLIANENNIYTINYNSDTSQYQLVLLPNNTSVNKTTFELYGFGQLNYLFKEITNGDTTCKIIDSFNTKISLLKC